MSGTVDFTSTISNAPYLGWNASTSIEPRSPRTLNVASGCDLPARADQQANDLLDETRVRRVKQTVEVLALPVEAERAARAERLGDVLEDAERQRHRGALRPRDRRLRDLRPGRELRLGPAPPSTQRPHAQSEANGIHADDLRLGDSTRAYVDR